MPEDTELEQGFRGRVTNDRQKVVDDVVHDIAGAEEAQRGIRRGPIGIEVQVGPGAERGPFREVAPGPGVTREFTGRPLPKEPQKDIGLEGKAPPREPTERPTDRDFGPVLPDGRRLFDLYFENFKTDILSRVDPHQGITADNYDFEALYQDPAARDEFRISTFSGQTLLPEKYRLGEGNFPPAQLLEAFEQRRNERLERGDINVLTPGEQAQLFNRLDNFINQPLEKVVTQADIEAFKKEQERSERRRKPQIRMDPRDRPGFTQETLAAGLNKIGARIPKNIKSAADALRAVELPGANTPSGETFTVGEVFRVFGIDEFVQIPKVEEETIDDPAVDIASEFFAIAATFLLLKGGGAPGINAPLVFAEVGTINPQENFANLLQELAPEAQNLILDTLAANPDNSDFEKLAKALITDVALPTIVVDGIIRALLAFKRAGGLRVLESERGSIPLGPGDPKKGKPKGGIDPQKDSLFAAIGKLGGINKADAIRFIGIDPKEKFLSGVFGKPLLRAGEKGRPFEEMADALGEAGYLKVDQHGKVDVSDLEDKFDLERRGEKQFALSKEFDVGAEAEAAELESLQEFKERTEFDIEEDIRADRIFEEAAAEADQEIAADLMDEIRELLQSDASAGEKLAGIIEKTPLRKAAGGAPTGKKSVGKILKGETENIPEEVVKRITGLKGRHIDIGGRLSINWTIVPDRLKVAIKIVREKFEKEIEAAVPIRPRTTPVLEARARIEKDLDAEIFEFMGRDFQKIPPNDTDVVVGNWIADDAALQLYKLQQAVLADVPGANFEFIKMLALNADVQKQRQLMSATTARTFSANGISPELTGVPFDTRDYAKEAAQFGENLPAGVDAKVIAQRMKNTVISPEGAATFNKQASDAMTRGRFSAAFLEYWINSLLSGPQTQAVNIGSNAAFAAWQIPERMLAAGVSKVLRTQDGVRIQESVSQIHGAIEGMTDGFKMLSHNIQRAFHPFKLSDVEVSISQKLEGARENAISSKNFKSLIDDDGSPNTLGMIVDYSGEVIRTPGKLLMSFDEWFKGIGYRMEVRAQAMRFAQQQIDDGVENFAQRIIQQEVDDLGLTAEKAAAHTRTRRTEILADNGAAELNKFYRATVDNPPPWITTKAVDAATYQTFTSELGQVGRKATALLNSHPSFRLFIPFFRTPVQLLSRTLERTPIGLITALGKKGAERDLALARVAMGSMSMAWAFNLASQGRITGNGPANFAQKSWLRAKGWQPNSIVTFKEDGTKVYTSINRFDPFGSWLTMAADMQMMWGYLGEEERQDLASAAVLALRNNVLSKTWFRGLAEATTSLQFNDPGRFIANFAGSMVPNIGATFEREREGHLQDVRTKDPTAGIGSTAATTNLKEFLNLPDTEITRPGGTHASLVLFERVLRKMKTRVPWMDDDDAPPDVDIWGEVRVLQGGWGPDIISPFWQSFEKDDPAGTEFIENKVDVGAVGNTIRGVRLTPKEKFRYAQLAGNLLKDEEVGNMGAHDYLNQMIKTPEYLALTKGKGGGRSHMLRSTLLAFRKKAALQTILESDRLKKALSIRLGKKQEKLTGQKGQQEEILRTIDEQSLNIQVR